MKKALLACMALFATNGLFGITHTIVNALDSCVHVQLDLRMYPDSYHGLAAGQMTNVGVQMFPLRSVAVNIQDGKFAGTEITKSIRGAFPWGRMIIICLQNGKPTIMVSSVII